MSVKHAPQARSRNKVVALDFHSLAIDPAPARPTDDQIRARAYKLFVDRGCIPGNPIVDWLDAEHQLIQELGSEAA